MTGTEWVRVIPGDDAGQVARDLLSLADSEYDVKTNTDDGLVFVVPEELARQYAELVGSVSSDPEQPKRGGRRRKETSDGN
jgi:hypothetical protein